MGYGIDSKKELEILMMKKGLERARRVIRIRST
jgi:hypothetical protein